METKPQTPMKYNPRLERGDRVYTNTGREGTVLDHTHRWHRLIKFEGGGIAMTDLNIIERAVTKTGEIRCHWTKERNLSLS